MSDGHEVGGPAWLRAHRACMDAVAEPLLAIGPRYEILAANQAFVEQTGHTEAEVVGRRCHVVSHRSEVPCWADGATCPLEAVLQNRRPCAVTHVHLDAEGRRRVVEVAAAPVRDARGEIVAVIESLRDVTAEVELREELARQNAELEQARLRREQHTSAVCHELGNILSCVRLNAEALLTRAASPQASAHASFILDETVRFGRLLEDLRDAAAMETQRFTLRCMPCDLVEIVRDAVAEHRAIVGDRLVTELGEPGVAGRWDGVRLRQVLDNLIGNAAKFSEAGGAIRVRLERTASGVLVSVEDRGSGIPPERMAHLFQPYARAHAGVAGLGLGLYLSRGIVEAHGGRISASSTWGEGTTVTFSLPCSADAEHAAGAHDATEAGAHPQ
ncbi:MAG: PAS domain-containing sensor histidine kinase [Myxococcales bacterium]|nr:PAS domain-containing sensor histidine kinase [Myxococcales bacterium]